VFAMYTRAHSEILMSAVVILVGASKGFGKDLLRECLNSSYISGSLSECHFILISSNEQAARLTWGSVYSESRGAAFGIDPRITVTFIETNLAQSASLGSAMAHLLDAIGCPTSVGRFFMFLNSGSVTPVGPILSLVNTDDQEFLASLDSHICLNMMSFTVLLRCTVRHLLSEGSSAAKLHIVNVSSLAAIKELYGMAVYCAIKAARDSMIRSLSLEIERDWAHVDARIISYAPGMMKTDMVQNDLIGGDNENAVKSIENPTFVNGAISAKRCVDLITGKIARDFKNGDHIDYYDL
jgi:NAD(P)-dependent dehydrogenase (short-subunit alcohol dehydrogenase family)